MGRVVGVIVMNVSVSMENIFIILGMVGDDVFLEFFVSDGVWLVCIGDVGIVVNGEVVDLF